MKNVTVYPVESRVAPLPDGSLIPADGKTVPLDTFVRRRLASGDLTTTAPVIATSAPVIATPAKKEKSEKKDDPA